MRALVDTVDTQRIVMDEQRSLTNVNTAADLSTALPPANCLANSLIRTIQFDVSQRAYYRLQQLIDKLP